MAGFNRVQLIGHLGRDPEIRSMQSGSQVAQLSLATSESWKDKDTGERKERTEWHRIVIFNENLVKVVKQYLKKGSKIFIEGSLQTRKWTDKDGAEKYTTEVVLQRFGGQILMLDGKPEENAAGRSDDGAGGVPPTGGYGAKRDDLDDEIPF